MTTKDAKYWPQRQVQLNAQLEKDEKKLAEKMARVYEKEMARLEKEVGAYYAAYGKDGVLEYRNLLRGLSDSDRQLLMERMEDFAKKYPEYEHLLPVRESIYKLDRLQGLQQAIYIQQLEIGAIEQKMFQVHLETLAASGYIAAGGRNLLNMGALKKLVNAKWLDNKNFSDRIWDNKAKLTQYLHNDFRNAVIRGDSYDRCVKELQRRFGVGKSEAYRLIYTEGTHVMNEASMTAFEGAYNEYKYVAIMDDRTSDVCAALNGEVFQIKDRMPGVNFPPMHPRCRSSYTIVIPHDFVDRYASSKEYGPPKKSAKTPTASSASRSSEKVEINGVKTIDDLKKQAKVI